MKKLVLLLPLCLMACAEMQKDYQTRTCHYDGAYQTGVNDAQNGKNMNVDPLVYNCPEESKEAVRKGYREGYTTAKRDAGPTNLIKALVGSNAHAPRCVAKGGASAHQNFCADKDKSLCQVHSGVCSWE